VLAGVAEGLHVWADPVGLNRAGWVAAILAGRETYRLTRTGLVALDSDRAKDDRIGGPIVARHKCREPIPPHHREISTPPQIENTKEIPF